MQRKAAQRLTTLFVGWLLLTSATSCADPPVPSADTSCERFRHISATDKQIDVLMGDEDFWGSYTDQIVSHNIEYDKACLGPTKP